MSTEINFTYPKFKALKQAYLQALRDERKSFIFEGNKYLTIYAKYMLVYLEDKFKALR